MKRLITLALAALFAAPLFAQHEGPGPQHLREKKEKVDAMKAAFITQELDLTAEEAQKFWPVFNEMDKLIEAIRMEEATKRIEMREAGKTIEDLSDAELEAMMKKMFDHEEAILMIKRDYHQKFIKVLGIKRTAMLYQAERKFQRELMRKTRKEQPRQREPMPKE